MKTIGILGGMGPLATADLFRNIVTYTKAEKDQEHIRVIIDSNTNIPDRTAYLVGSGENPFPEMLRSALTLEKAGADFLIMPCNTAHCFYEELCRKIDIPFLNMVAETAGHINKLMSCNAKAGLLATDGVIKTGIYDKYFSQSEITLLKPEKTQKSVMKFIYDVIKKGNFEAGTEYFDEAAAELKSSGAEKFILGCTELSSAKYIYKMSNDFIDPLEIIAKKAIEFAGGKIK